MKVLINALVLTLMEIKYPNQWYNIFINMSVIDEVKQKTDIVEVVSQYTKLTKAGRTFRALCPFHSEKTPSFFVYPEQQSWHCFGACNTGGDVFSFIMKKEGVDFGQALRLMAQRTGVVIPSRIEGKKKDEKERLYQTNEAAAKYFHDLLINFPAAEKARNYLASRGLSSKSTSDFELGFSLDSWEALNEYLTAKGHTANELLELGLVVATEEGKTFDRFRGKLMFPIKDNRGHVVGFGARVLDDSLPKYVNSPQTPLFDKSGSLYGIDLAAPAIRQKDLAVIVEGYLDVIIAHQYGFNNVVASMGTAITDKQVGTIKKLTNKIYLALDDDAAGEEATIRSINYENTFGVEMRFVILPKGKDPDDVIKENTQAWQDLIATALPVVDYTFNKDESLAMDRLLPIIARIENDLRRDRYLTKLEKLTGISYNKIEGAAQALRRQKVNRTKSNTEGRVLRPLVSSPLEEYCLILLLRYPRLKAQNQGLLAEHFENSENREIFVACEKADEPESIRVNLTPAIWEHFDSLITREIPSSQIEQKYTDCVIRLKERFLRGLAAKKEAALVDISDEPAKFDEQEIKIATELKKIFNQRAKRGGRYNGNGKV